MGKEEKVMDEQVKMQVFRPAWRSFYGHILGVAVCFAAVVVGVARYSEYWKIITGLFSVAALYIAGHMAIKRFSVSLLVKPEEIILERGFVGRGSIGVGTSNIRTIQVSQNIMQRLLDVGNLLVGSAAAKDCEISVADLPKPYAVRDLIQAYERAAENRKTPEN
jgi:uncharacterized membrane protein YdbT with pleckstrin-like domain